MCVYVYVCVPPTHVMMVVSSCRKDVSPSISLCVIPLMGVGRYCEVCVLGTSRRRFSWYSIREWKKCSHDTGLPDTAPSPSPKECAH